MKKGLFILLLCFFFTSCSFLSTKRLDVFGFDENIELEKLYDSYSGPPYEGMSLYTFKPDKKAKEIIKDWEDLPLSKDVDDYLDTLGLYIEKPEVKDGKWKFIDRNKSTKIYKNVSVCIYDSDKEICYLINSDS